MERKESLDPAGSGACCPGLTQGLFLPVAPTQPGGGSEVHTFPWMDLWAAGREVAAPGLLSVLEHSVRSPRAGAALVAGLTPLWGDPGHLWRHF